MSELTATFDATTETVMRLPAPWLVLGNLARLEATYILHQVTEDGVVSECVLSVSRGILGISVSCICYAVPGGSFLGRG